MLTTIATLCSTLLALGAPTTDPALRGLDPVRLAEGAEVAGRAELELEHGRFRYRFASEETRRRFRDDPARWEIQWGGGCGRMGPLSGAGDPDRWAVHAGRVYVFASDGCRAGFLSAPERFVVPTAPPASATPADLAAGADWIERAARAHGGAAVDAPRAFRTVRERESHGWTEQVEQLVAREAILRRSTWTPPDAGATPSVTTWVVGDAPFVEEGLEPGDPSFAITSPEQRADVLRYAHREPLSFLRARGERGFRAAYLGPGRLDGNEVANVLVEHQGLQTTLHLDPASARIRGITWRGRLDDGVTREISETFTVWSDVDGVVFPTGRTVAVDGEAQPDLGVVWSTVELLADVPERAFARRPR